MLSPEIATKLDRIARRLHADRVARDRLIVEAHQAGASLREIAKAAAISHVAVLKIVRAGGGGADLGEDATPPQS